ncbi:MAG: hypothetical protein ACKOAK_02310, partial [Ignavibacteria bacterium]
IPNMNFMVLLQNRYKKKNYYTIGGALEDALSERRDDCARGDNSTKGSNEQVLTKVMSIVECDAI